MAPDIKLNGTLVASMGWLQGTISFPMPQSQSNTIVVLGRNSPIRYTEALGRVSYQPRNFFLTFSMLGPRKKHDQMTTEMTNHYAGQLIRVSTSEESEPYTIDALETSSEYDPLSGKGQPVTPYEDVDSYRYHNDETVINLTGSGTSTIGNDLMPVVPIITTSTGTAFSWTINNDSFRKSSSIGMWTLPEFELQVGTSTVVIQGIGTTVFQFREGRL